MIYIYIYFKYFMSLKVYNGEFYFKYLILLLLDENSFFFFSFLHDEFENTSKHITLATIGIPVNIKTGI